MTNKITKLMLNGEGYEIREYQAGWQPGANTIFYFDFEQNMDDSSDNNIQVLSYLNVGYEQAGGQYAIKSTASGSYIQLPTNIGNNLTDFTVSFWLYPIIGGGQTYVMLFGEYAYDGSNWVGPHIFYYNDGHFSARVNSNNEKNVGNLTQNVWQHIVFTRSSGTCTAYLNGQPTGSSFTDTTQWDLTTQQYPDFYIFSRASQCWTGAGQMGDKYIYESVAWTETEIQNYYNSTKSLYGIS